MTKLFKIYVVQKRRLTDFQAQKLLKGSPGNLSIIILTYSLFHEDKLIHNKYLPTTAYI